MDDETARAAETTLPGAPLDPSQLAAGQGPRAAAPTAPARKAAVAFILATALIDIVSIGIIIPVLPPLVVGFVGNEAKGAQVYGYFGAAFALMQFIFSPFQGALSDRFGRRPVLLASIFGLGCDFVFMALAPSLGWLFVGRIISGMTAASFSTANAYIADLNADEPDDSKRAAAFGLMGTVFSVGFIIGPGLGGLLAHLGPRAPFWGAACFSLLNAVYGFFVLPESLPLDRRAPFQLRNANPISSMKVYGSHPQLPRFALILLLFYLAVQVFISSFVLYVGYRYHWGPTLVGAALMASGGASMIVQWTVIKPFVKRFGERTAIYTGFAFGTAAFIIYGAAPVGWIYWLGVPFSAMSGLIMPGLQGVMTRRVPRTMQGRLQGANAGVMALTGLVGPIFFTSLFAWSISGGRQLPGVALFVAAGLYVAAALITVGAPHLDTAAAP